MDHIATYFKLGIGRVPCKTCSMISLRTYYPKTTQNGYFINSAHVAKNLTTLAELASIKLPKIKEPQNFVLYKEQEFVLTIKLSEIDQQKLQIFRSRKILEDRNYLIEDAKKWISSVDSPNINDDWVKSGKISGIDEISSIEEMSSGNRINYYHNFTWPDPSQLLGLLASYPNFEIGFDKCHRHT